MAHLVAITFGDEVHLLFVVKSYQIHADFHSSDQILLPVAHLISATLC